MISILLTILVIFGMTMLTITGVGIVGGLSKKHIIEPIYQRYFVPPLYVDDPRCCR